MTDAGLAEIAAMQGIDHLELRACAITDKGLNSLVRMKGLRVLDARFTKISSEGVARLTKELPKCEVVY